MCDDIPVCDSANRTEPVRLIVAERRPIVREGIRKLIDCSPDIELAAAAADGAILLHLMRREPPDVVLLSTSIRGRGFFDTLRRVRAARPDIPIVVMSATPEPTHLTRTLTMGACAYVSDDSASGELLAAIHAVNAGTEYLSQSLRNAVSRPSQCPAGTPGHAQLSNREYEVLCLMGEGKAIGAIAPELGLSAKTVSTYRSRLQRKLNLRSSAEIIRYAIEHNLVNNTSRF